MGAQEYMLAMGKAYLLGRELRFYEKIPEDPISI
jgi:hypothetical protein